MVEPAPQAHDTMAIFERWWLVPAGVLLMFGLVNAGVPLHGLEEGMGVGDSPPLSGDCWAIR